MTGPVLVTGATGTVGRDVVAQLQARGAAVRAAGRDPAAVRARFGDVEAAAFDWLDRSTWDAALGGASAVLLVRPPQISDVKGTLLPFIDLAAERGVPRTTFLSVQGAGSNPVVPHHAVEKRLQQVSGSWTLLRPSYFLQNLTGVHRADIRDADRIAVPAGSGRTAFVDTRDVAEVAAQALTDPAHEGRAYELTGPAAHTYTEVAHVLSAALGRRVRYTRPGALRYVVDERRTGTPLPLVLVTLALYTTARFGLAAHTSPELAGLLGRPARDLTSFVDDNLPSWRP